MWPASSNVRVREQSGKHMLALSSSQFDLKRTQRCPVQVQNSNTAFDLEKWALLRDGGEPEQDACGGERRQAARRPLSPPPRLGMLECGGCGCPHQVELWGGNWKAKVAPVPGVRRGTGLAVTTRSLAP